MFNSTKVCSNVKPSTSRRLVQRHDDGKIAFRRRTVATDKLPFRPVNDTSNIRRGRNVHYLGKHHLLWTQLPDHRLQFREANIVVERTQVKLRRGAVQHTNTKATTFLGIKVLANGDAMAGLFVRKEFLVNESSIGVNFVELSVNR